MYYNQIRTLLSSPCQLGLGVVLRHLSLCPYTMWTKIYGSRGVKRGWGENSVSRMWDRKEVAMVGLESSGKRGKWGFLL